MFESYKQCISLCPRLHLRLRCASILTNTCNVLKVETSSSCHGNCPWLLRITSGLRTKIMSEPERIYERTICKPPPQFFLPSVLLLKRIVNYLWTLSVLVSQWHLGLKYNRTEVLMYKSLTVPFKCLGLGRCFKRSPLLTKTAFIWSKYNWK